MKKIIELVKYRMHIYFRGSRFVMPFVAMAIFLAIMYFSASVGGVVDSCVITYNFVFFLMVWIGLNVSSAESRITEQILFLRLHNPVHYYISKVLFLMVLGFMVNGIGLLPYIISWVAGGGFFIRVVTFYDVLNVFILLCGASVVGASVGDFFYSGAVKDRKDAIVLTTLVAVVIFVRTSIIKEVTFAKIFAWVLPPLDTVLKIYNEKTDFFQIGKSFGLFLVLLFYALIFWTIKSFICYKRKFYQ